MFSIIRWCVAPKTQACTSNVKVTLRGLKGQNENCLKRLYFFRPTSQPCIIRFPSYWAHMFTMMRWHVAHKTQACALNVKVTLRGIKGQNENCLIGLYLFWPTSQPCIIGLPSYWAHRFTMMRWHVAHKTQVCASKVNVTLRGQRSNWETMDHRIPSYWVHKFTMIRWHVAHNTQACNWNVQVTLTGQRSKWAMFDRTVSKMYAVHCWFLSTNAHTIHNVLSLSGRGLLYCLQYDIILFYLALWQ